jgi:hypothetical protein
MTAVAKSVLVDAARTLPRRLRPARPIRSAVVAKWATADAAVMSSAQDRNAASTSLMRALPSSHSFFNSPKRPMQMNSNCGWGDTETGGDVPWRLVVYVSQRDALSLPSRERPYQIRDEHRIRRRRVDSNCGPRFQSCQTSDQSGFGSRSAAGGYRAVRDDAHQPRVRPVVFADSSPRGEGRHEGVLDNFLASRRVARQRDGQPERALAVCLVEEVEAALEVHRRPATLGRAMIVRVPVAIRGVRRERLHDHYSHEAPPAFTGPGSSSFGARPHRRQPRPVPSDHCAQIANRALRVILQFSAGRAARK